MTLDPSALDSRQLYRYLSTAVAPRPIAFASTVSKGGQVNLSPFSYFNVFSTTPPILVFSPLNRGRDGTSKDTLNNLHDVPEVVINLVSYGIVEQMSLASGNYPSEVNEFTKGGLTEVASEAVRPPRVKESPVAFECRVDRIVELGAGAGAGHLVVAEVVRMHLLDGILDGDNQLNTLRLDLVARLGGNDYLRVIPEAVFSIPKPTEEVGMGVDALPAHIRDDDAWSGGELARMATLSELPDETLRTKVNAYPEVQKARASGAEALYGLTKKYLRANRIREALAILMQD